MKQKAKANEAEAALANQAVITAVDDENSDFANLSASLAEIRKLKGVNGYILRSNTSAIVDLNNPDKITEQAILSYQIYESCQEMRKQLCCGEMESILVEAEKTKVLCMFRGENKMSVFMDKNAPHAWIIKRILI